MNKSEIIQLLDAEINWCNEHPMESTIHPEFRYGFIEGLKQAKRLVDPKKFGKAKDLPIQVVKPYDPEHDPFNSTRETFDGRYSV